LPVYRLGPDPVFPPPGAAEPGGLLAVGGDLAPERLLRAYAAGIFPWYEEEPILWFSPDPRGVLPLGQLHVPRRLARTLRQGRFALTLDRAFPDVIRACAATRRAGQRGTWITAEMERAYVALHELGLAHSVEVFEADELVGGLYGVALGGAFFGESMFHRRRDASNAALVVLAWQLRDWGFTLFDTQLPSAHLTRFGGRAWPRTRFLRELARALAHPTRRGPWHLDPALLEKHLGPRDPTRLRV
jgi:leucyl/phenylalanyl-tRNA--protein transferase